MFIVARFTELGKLVSSLKGPAGLVPCALHLWQAVIIPVSSLMNSQVSGPQLYRTVTSELHVPNLFHHSSYNWVSRRGCSKMLGLPQPIHDGQVNPQVRKLWAIVRDLPALCWVQGN